MSIWGMLIIDLLADLLVVNHSKSDKYAANDIKYNLDNLYYSDPSLRVKALKAEQERKEKINLAKEIHN